MVKQNLVVEHIRIKANEDGVANKVRFFSSGKKKSFLNKVDDQTMHTFHILSIYCYYIHSIQYLLFKVTDQNCHLRGTEVIKQLSGHGSPETR